MMRGAAAALVVLRKELADALRDRRTLATVLVSSVLMGPLVLLAISGLVATLESRAEQREVYVAGLAHAPTLRNYLERQTYTVKEAPADFEARLRSSKFSDPVVVVPDDFETALVRGDVPVVEIRAAPRVRHRLRRLRPEGLINRAEQRAADAEVDEDAHGREHERHREREREREPEPDRKAAQVLDRNRYPTPRTVSRESVPNGLSIFSRR